MARGDGGRVVFEGDEDRKAWLGALGKACAAHGWRVHAWVLMGNHFHLLLETPEPNLVSGMKWLMGVFSQGWNRRRLRRGHVFQGRYKAVVVNGEARDAHYLRVVADYIHLNPVRAEVLPVECLGEFRYSSYWHLGQPNSRPAFFNPETALTEAGGLADTAAGRRCYADYLAWQAAEGPVGKNATYVSLSKGWVLGTGEFKAALIKDHALVAAARAWENQGASEIREQAWEALLRRAFIALGRTEADLVDGPKSAPWKVAIMVFLKERSQVSNPWLARRLGLLGPAYVSRLCSDARRIMPPSAELSVLRHICTT
jgi:REP element-mobilizing transposase RayT